ncbi:phospholipase D2, partial [Tachysurus ichikawai]
KLIIKCNSYRQAQWWSHEIRRLSERCDFLQLHRFAGFAPPRPDSLTKCRPDLNEPPCCRRKNKKTNEAFK